MKTSAIQPIRQRHVGLFGLAGVCFLTLSPGLGGKINADAQEPKAAITSRTTAPTAIAAPTFAVSGAISKPGTWSVARLEQEFAGQMKTVDYVLKGAHHTAKCVPLVVVLSASGPRVNPRIKHHELAFTLLVQGKDGYTVAFSWGELQPDIGKSAAWLALDRDNAPLPGDASPVELLMPGDEKQGRWVHGVSKIVVIDGTTLPDDSKSLSSP